jgi:predicted GTPase
MGIDNCGRNVLINTEKYFSIFIGGSTGDGKTSLILSVIKSWLSSVSNDADIIIFDTKGLDWNNLKLYPRTKIFELNSIEALQEADQFLKNFLIEFHASKKALSAHNLIHYEDVRRKGVSLPLKRKILILDEAARYLNPEESTSKEEKDLKQSIVNSVTAILAQCRVSGCPVIVSTQRVQADEMAIPRLYKSANHRLLQAS